MMWLPIPTRYVDGTPTSEVILVTILYICPPHHGHISQYHGHIIFIPYVNRLSHSWDKAISNSDLETPRSRSWVWSKSKVIQLAEYPINLLPFHFTSIRSTIPAEEVFWNFTLKHSRSRSWVKGQGHILYPVSNGCFSNRFDVRGKNCCDGGLNKTKTSYWDGPQGSSLEMKTEMFFISYCSCLYAICRSQVLSHEWRCSWSSADRCHSNYIWVMNNFFVLLGCLLY